MNEWCTCTACGLRHARRGDQRCPRCGAAVGVGAPVADAQREAVTAPSAASAGAPRAFAHEAARASWIIPIVAVLLTGTIRRSHALAADVATMLCVLAGVALAVAALAGTRRHGRRGILLPALAGVLVNGALILIFVSNFLAVRV